MAITTEPTKSMDSQKPDDPWASLANEFGIEPQDEPTASNDSPDDDITKAKFEEPKFTEAKSIPAPRESDWGSLANELGLEAEGEVDEDETDEITEDSVLDEPEDKEVVVESTSAKAGLAPEVDLSAFEMEQSDEFLEEASDAAKELLGEDDDDETDSDLDVADSELELTDVEIAVEETPAGFGVGTWTLPDWFPLGGKKKKPEIAEEPEAEEEAADSDEADAEPADAEAANRDSEEGDEDGARRRGRRRRGRRRGRGRGKSTSSEAAEESDDATEEPSDDDEQLSEAVESDGEQERSGRKRRSRRRRKPVDSDVADVETDDLDDEAEEGDSSPRRAPSHKNIPSWLDAIGVVVDSNIAARSERKRSSRSNGRGGRGSGRGRSRGRRPKRDDS